MDAVFLLEARFMRLVDDDQAEIGIGQEQRGACADRHQSLAARDCAPSAAPLRGAQSRVPRHGFAAETIVEAFEERLGQRNFREQDQNLPAFGDRLRHRLEIDFGLARPRHAVEQHRLKDMGGDPRDQRVRRRALILGQVGTVVVRIGQGEGAVDVDFDPLDRAVLDETPDHRVGDIGHRRQLADQPLPVADPLQRLGTLWGQAVGDMAGDAVLGHGPCALQRGGGGQRHAHHGRWRGEIIIRRPLDQPAQGRG
jgi:hypothetical protein